MPRILKIDEKDFATKSDPFTKQHRKHKGEGFYNGGGIFQTLWENKELIGNVAKAVSSVGSAASKVSDAAKSKNELDQIREISALKEKSIQAEKEKNKQLSNDMKMKIQKIGRS